MSREPSIPLYFSAMSTSTRFEWHSPITWKGNPVTYTNISITRNLNTRSSFNKCTKLPTRKAGYIINGTEESHLHICKDTTCKIRKRDQNTQVKAQTWRRGIVRISSPKATKHHRRQVMAQNLLSSKRREQPKIHIWTYLHNNSEDYLLVLLRNLCNIRHQLRCHHFLILPWRK